MTSAGTKPAAAADPTSVVKAFMESIGTTNEENISSFVRFMAPSSVWDTGSRVLSSLEDSLAHLRSLPETYGVEAFSVHVLHLVGNDRVVLTERVDDLIAIDGGLLHQTRVMGIFEVEDGLVTAWRDYYDTAGLARDLAAIRASKGDGSS